MSPSDSLMYNYSFVSSTSLYTIIQFLHENLIKKHEKKLLMACIYFYKHGKVVAINDYILSDIYLFMTKSTFLPYADSIYAYNKANRGHAIVQTLSMRTCRPIEDML